jgi:hypothetical protein
VLSATTTRSRHQNCVHADRTAIARNEGTVIPRTIAIAEKVIIRILCKICAGKIEAPAPGRSGASKLFGGDLRKR